MPRQTPRRHHRRTYRPPVDDAARRQTPYERGRADLANNAPRNNVYINVDDRADYDRGYEEPRIPAARCRTTGGKP